MKRALALMFIALALGISAIVNGIMNWHHGIYASMHYIDAQNAAIHVLSDSYGQTVLVGMRLDTPDVVNTHLDKITQQPSKTNSPVAVFSGQVRVFHFIGRRGVRYCVGVWDYSYDSHSYYYGRYFITKNCIYSENQ